VNVGWKCFCVCVKVQLVSSVYIKGQIVGQINQLTHNIGSAKTICPMLVLDTLCFMCIEETREVDAC
jgi:hypothetical protein